MSNTPQPLYMRHFESYRIASAVRDIVIDPFPYLRKVSEFFEDWELCPEYLVKPFPKRTVFHNFIEHILWHLLDEYAREEVDFLNKLDPNDFYFRYQQNKLWLEVGLDKHKICYTSFLDCSLAKTFYCRT